MLAGAPPPRSTRCARSRQPQAVLRFRINGLRPANNDYLRHCDTSPNLSRSLIAILLKRIEHWFTRRLRRPALCDLALAASPLRVRGCAAFRVASRERSYEPSDRDAQSRRSLACDVAGHAALGLLVRVILLDDGLEDSLEILGRVRFREASIRGLESSSYRFSTSGTFPAADSERIDSIISAVVTRALA